MKQEEERENTHIDTYTHTHLNAVQAPALAASQAVSRKVSELCFGLYHPSFCLCVAESDATTFPYVLEPQFF